MKVYFIELSYSNREYELAEITYKNKYLHKLASILTSLQYSLRNMKNNYEFQSIDSFLDS